MITKTRIAKLALAALAAGMDADAVQEAALSYLDTRRPPKVLTATAFNGRVRSRWRNAKNAEARAARLVGGTMDLAWIEDQGSRVNRGGRKPAAPMAE